MSVHVFPEEMSLRTSRLSKEDPPSPSQVGFTQPIEDPSRTERQREVEFALSLSLLFQTSVSLKYSWHTITLVSDA